MQQRLAEQFRLMGDSLGLPAAGGITLEAAAAAHDVLSGMLDADVSDDEDVEDDLAHLTPESGIHLPSILLGRALALRYSVSWTSPISLAQGTR